MLGKLNHVNHDSFTSFSQIPVALISMGSKINYWVVFKKKEFGTVVSLHNQKETANHQFLRWVTSCWNLGVIIHSVFYITVCWEEEESSRSKHRTLKLNSSLLLIARTKKETFWRIFCSWMKMKHKLSCLSTKWMFCYDFQKVVTWTPLRTWGLCWSLSRSQHI